MLALQGAVEDMLLIVLEADGRFVLSLRCAHLVVAHGQIAVVPHQLVQGREYIVHLRMEGQPLFPVGVGAILDVARGFRIVVVIHVLAAVHILVTGREEEAQPVVHHAVAIGQRGQEVGQGSLGCEAQVLHTEVGRRDAVLSDIAQSLVGRLGGNASMVEGEEIAVEVERVVAR